MLKHYSCNKYPRYSIRNHYFERGLFETDDPAVQALIESVDGYGVFIHPVETAEEIAAMRAAELQSEEPSEQEEPTPVAVQGARGTAASKRQRKAQVINPGAKE